jgi:hypothetical protein
LAVAVGVLVVVASPYLRSGSRILTPDGERVVERAKVQAKQKPVAAAGSTWHGLIALRQWISRAWTPVSELLHQGLDRLEGHSPEQPHRAENTAGQPRIGRPRPIPADSGEIPEIHDDGTAHGREAPALQRELDDSQVIDLRHSEEADHPAGSARHAR